MNSNLLLKIYYDQKTKRCTLPSEFSKVIEAVRCSFSISGMEENFDIYYMDEEKDMILIENQFDYENALLFLKQNNHSTLKITIRTKNDRFDHSTAIKYLENSSLNSINLSRISITNSKIEKNENFEPANMKCEFCGRNFSSLDSQMRHSKICFKVFGTKRIPFDSKKQRKVCLQTMCDALIKEKMDINMMKLKKIIRSWRKSCNNVEGIQRSFRDLYIDVDSIECTLCKRKFNKASHKKHSKYCMKLMVKRKPFDSRCQRLMNMEHVELPENNEMRLKSNKNLMSKQTEPRWKRLSKKFKEIVRASKMWFKPVNI